jgi:putative membrane-bound dehydrogenase-like protein
MKRLFAFLTLVFCLSTATTHADPLRVFIRGGVKTHGPNAHEHERFLNDWKVLLAERGMKTDGAMEFPTADQLAQTDVMIVYAEAAGNITPEQRPILENYLKRGGGLVIIHTGTVANKPDTSPYWKSIIGGSWVQGQTKWKEGPMNLYYVENERLGGGHPITKGASNFQLDDEIYYDMDISPDVRVLATAYTPNVKAGKKAAEGGKVNVFDIQPQMWTYERTIDGGAQPYRAFVSIPGHLYSTFSLPQYRAILLRGIAWAAHRENLDEFCKKEELASLTYPPGGPSRPADERAQLEVNPDFKMTLVASEPLITKPICLNWDPSGRLWVAESPEYPNGRRGMRPDYRGKEWKDHGGLDPFPGEQERAGHDKISILTSSKGDGVMDTKQIFYEGLDLVTGFVFYKDGVIVTQAPDILFIHDPGPDGKARKVEKLYSNLGTRDTHAVINNPRWGWDGWIYATHGYSSSQNVSSGDGSKDFGVIGSGVVRFKPDGSAIEQYSSKGGNTWGLQITADNRVMWTQPTSGQLLMQTLLPESTLARGKIGNTTSFNVIIKSDKVYPLITWDQLPYAQIDWVGSFTAAAGCAIYDGGSWPAQWNGSYFCTEPTVNIVHQRFLDPEGSSFTWHKQPGREETEFVRSKDMWFRPIESRIGPDGALYILDFYNQAVIHNDTRGTDHNNVNAAVRPDRDHYFGRIWRIDHKDAKKLTVPDLSKAGARDLANALENPNRTVRMTAARLLVEKGGGADEVAKHLSSPSAVTRIAALWTLERLSADPHAVEKALGDSDTSVQRNAANLIESGVHQASKSATEKLLSYLKSSDGQLRVAALRALAIGKLDHETAVALVAAWPQFEDDFQRSAAVAAAANDPAAVIGAALDHPDPTSLSPLVNVLVQNIDAAAAGRLVIALADKPASVNGLKRGIFAGIARSLKDAPAMSPELSAALGKLLDSAVADAALPLAARWDKSGVLKAQVAKLSSELLARVADTKAGDNARLSAAQSLIALRNTNPAILPTIIAQLGKDGSADFKRALVTALGETDDAAVGPALSKAFGTLPDDVRLAAFDAVLKRADWTNAFLDAIEAKQVDIATLGPANAFRLRAHPDKAVAKRASGVLDKLNPLAKAKKEAIAKILPVAEQKGDAEHGKQLFTTTCAICHNFHGAGADIGPGLTGMGAHGAEDLLVAIVDPNAEVDPSFVQWNIETKDGQAYAGVIASENPATITLKSLAGVQQVKKADIKSRVNTGRSLMPEGFEGLGAEALRDIITYFQSVDGAKFRLVDLREAFTASTGAGLYNSQAMRGDSFVFKKTGNVSVGGIPFNIVGPDKAPLNIVVLKGGPQESFSRTLPARVEARLGGFTANRLHFLGGVAGWGAKGSASPSELVKVTVSYSDGQKESLVFSDGIEFADYIRPIEVPGSKLAEGLVDKHQLRWFSKQLTRTAPIEKLTIESVNEKAAATLVAITAELADANAVPLSAPSAPAPKDKDAAGAASLPAGSDAGFVPQFTDPVPQPPAARPAKGPRVLLVGGGSSHDFVKFFGGTDKATLAPVVGWVDFTQNANGVPPILDRVDVLVWSANQPVSSATCKALLDFADRGKGIVALHPGTWYAWKNFPEWNAQIVGGGTRGHDKLGPFTVKITNPNHPVTKGVSLSFEITDELYNYNADPNGSPVEVLAETTSPNSGKTFPQVFVVKHPKSRIVGITLGHDARAHDLPEFQTLLKNAVTWAGAK